MWFAVNKTNNSKKKPKSFQCLWDAITDWRYTLKNPHNSLSYGSLFSSHVLFFHRRTEEFNLAVLVKYDICGVLKGKHRHIFVFCCWFIWIHLLLPCLRPWKMNFRSPSFITGVIYYYSPFSLCVQLTVYVKLVFHLLASFLGYTRPLGSLSWKNGKPTDYLW